MTDKRREMLQEQYEEAALSLMMDEIAEEEGQQLLQQFDLTEQAGELPELPDALDEKNKHLIRDTFHKQNRKERLRRAAKRLTVTCVCVLIFFGLSATLINSVDALRIYVGNFLLSQDERFSTILLSDEAKKERQENQEQTLTMMERLIMAPIPPEYELIIEQYLENGLFFMCLMNQEEDIIQFSAYDMKDSVINVDTEDAKVTETEICGHVATFIEKDEYTLLWLDEENGLLYDLYASNMDYYLFWEIAEVLAQ